MQLRHKLFIVLALVSSVPLLILLFGVVERMEQEVRIRTETQLHATLDKMASELELILDNQKSIAHGLSQVPAVRGFVSMARLNSARSKAPDYQRRTDELEQFFLSYQKSVTSIQAVRLIDASGKTLVKVKEGKPIQPEYVEDHTGRLFIADQSNRSFFKDARQTSESVVMSDFELGQVEVGADFCPAMVRYSVPLRDEVGNFEGVLVVNMWGSELDAKMVSALSGYPGKTYIVELADNPLRDGIYLYHPDNTKRFANQLGSDFKLTNEITPDEWQYMRRSQQNGSLFLADGRTLFYQKLAPYKERPTQWVIIIEPDQGVLLGPIKSMRQSIWWLLGALLVISLLMAVWTSGRLTRPVHQLADIIRQYADGHRSARFNADRKRTDEINQAGSAFNYLAEQLEHSEKERENAVRAACQSERLAALGQLAAGIGHEINNPLMNMMSLASLVQDALPGKEEQIRTDLQLLQKEGQRCARIVQGVLNFARQSEPRYEQFDMAALLDETLDLLRHRIETADIELQTLIETPLYMDGDAGQLQQVLVNIILNAIQASPAGARLYISAKSTDAQIEVEIVDEGHGINDSDYSKLFDPFFTTKPEGQGTGLGLSVSYGIIRHHNGTIRLENTAHAGVRVIIALPRHSKPHTEHAVQMLEAKHVG